jgi:hypothetical protein
MMHNKNDQLLKWAPLKRGCSDGQASKMMAGGGMAKDKDGCWLVA